MFLQTFGTTGKDFKWFQTSPEEFQQLLDLNKSDRMSSEAKASRKEF